VKVGEIPENEFDPEEWGKVYPIHYELWLKTREPKKKGQSTYRRGWDDDRIVYDRLSEFPFSALLYNGWGFGIEYNEPRGHYYAVIDQIEIDPSRTDQAEYVYACKTPITRLNRKKGMEY
jgi:nitrite reductase (cytochrome c-552)